MTQKRNDSFYGLIKLQIPLSELFSRLFHATTWENTQEFSLHKGTEPLLLP